MKYLSKQDQLYCTKSMSLLPCTVHLACFSCSGTNPTRETTGCLTGILTARGYRTRSTCRSPTSCMSSTEGNDIHLTWNLFKLSNSEILPANGVAKVMFSFVYVRQSVILSVHIGGVLTWPPPGPFQTCLRGIPPSSPVPSPGHVLLTIHGFPPPDMFKRFHYVAHTVCKWAVDIRLKSEMPSDNLDAFT